MTTKQRIMEILKRRTIDLKQLAKDLDKSQSTVSEHLADLMGEKKIECLIFMTDRGRHRYYRTPRGLG